MLKNKSIYWNPLLETLPREKLQALQLKKFRRIAEWAYNNSPFYHRHYKEAGLEPGDIKRFEDIRKVPKIEKGMFREVQKNEPFPYGDMLAVPREKIAVFRQIPHCPHVRTTVSRFSSGLCEVENEQVVQLLADRLQRQNRSRRCSHTRHASPRCSCCVSWKSHAETQRRTATIWQAGTKRIVL